MPISQSQIIEEGIACVEAGASIVHFHAYNADTEKQADEAALYAEVIDGIRAKVDAIVYGTLPMIGTQNVVGAENIAERHAAMQELAERKLIEWMVVDPGSVNFAAFTRARPRSRRVHLPQPGCTYPPRLGDVRAFQSQSELRDL